MMILCYLHGCKHISIIQDYQNKLNGAHFNLLIIDTSKGKNKIHNGNVCLKTIRCRHRSMIYILIIEFRFGKNA